MSEEESEEDCVIPTTPIPPDELSRYSVERDMASELDVSNYMASQAPDENVKHIEKIKREVVMGDAYDIWDVTTDKDRWWVINNPTNLYSQQYFTSLDYTLSFHIGLMMRVRSRSQGPDGGSPTPFDEVLRRLTQSQVNLEEAVEVEELQAVGMSLRECLLTLAISLRRHLEIEPEEEAPQAANFIAWSELIANELCPGRKNKEMRSHVKETSRSTWQLVNCLTHTRSTGRSSAEIALSSVSGSRPTDEALAEQ